jgi:hypothetical protein
MPDTTEMGASGAYPRTCQKSSHSRVSSHAAQLGAQGVQGDGGRGEGRAGLPVHAPEGDVGGRDVRVGILDSLVVVPGERSGHGAPAGTCRSAATVRACTSASSVIERAPRAATCGAAQAYRV